MIEGQGRRLEKADIEEYFTPLLGLGLDFPFKASIGGSVNYKPDFNIRLYTSTVQLGEILEDALEDTGVGKKLATIRKKTKIDKVSVSLQIQFFGCFNIFSLSLYLLFQLVQPVGFVFDLQLSLFVQVGWLSKADGDSVGVKLGSKVEAKLGANIGFKMILFEAISMAMDLEEFGRNHPLVESCKYGILQKAGFKEACQELKKAEDLAKKDRDEQGHCFVAEMQILHKNMPLLPNLVKDRKIIKSAESCIQFWFNLHNKVQKKVKAFETKKATAQASKQSTSYSVPFVSNFLLEKGLGLFDKLYDIAIPFNLLFTTKNIFVLKRAIGNSRRLDQASFLIVYMVSCADCIPYLLHYYGIACKCKSCLSHFQSTSFCTDSMSGGVYR